ncbi:MAG: UDP-N-acetylglucosamine 1-carboxyvinyltransferase [Gemmatimonadota bacterium]
MATTETAPPLVVRQCRLEGAVELSGAKNSALKLLTASILTDERVTLYRSPSTLLDMQVHVEMLRSLGKRVVEDGHTLTIAEEDAATTTDLIWNGRSIRNTLLMLGSLTTRFGGGRVPLPGGCRLGERKYDLHVMVLERLGAQVWEEDGYLCARAGGGGRLKGAEIHLPLRSTGATENAILAGSLARGRTTVWNPHIRPEILDLIALLRTMGARIQVHGQRSIEIDGVERLGGARHTVIPDNVEALTWAVASVITGGDVEIVGFPFEHLEVPLIFLRESGKHYYRGQDSLVVRGGSAYPVEISTGPYPGINSDMQPLFAVYGASSEGTSKIIDLRFPPLTGATVRALDLRAGIALLLAGMVAEGETRIEDAWQIERGYEFLIQKLDALRGG